MIHASDRLTVGTLGTLMPPAANLGKNAGRNEEQGYAALWWPDHFMGWFPQSLWTPDITPLAAFQANPDIFFDPLIAIAAAAGATNRVKLGTAVTEALRRHPVELAQAFLTLDHLAPGRIICGVGSVEALNLLPYGIPFDHPVSRLEEAVRIIRLLWSSDGPVDFEGEHFRLERAVLGLQPTPEGPPEIWLAAHGPRMLEITGRYSDGWLPEFLPLDDYRGRLQRIQQARAAAGRSAEPFTPGMYVKLVLTDDHEKAHALMKTPLLRILALTQPAEAFARHGATHPLGQQAFGVSVLRELIGRQSDEVLVEVERGAIRKFAEAVGDTTEACIRGDIAPPTFPTTIRIPIPGLTFDLARVLHGGQEYRFERPILAGDRLRCRTRLRDVYQREGRLGAMTFLIIELEGRSEDGEPVFSGRSTVIVR